MVDVKITIKLPEIPSSVIRTLYYLLSDGEIIITPFLSLQTKCAAVYMKMLSLATSYGIENGNCQRVCGKQQCSEL